MPETTHSYIGFIRKNGLFFMALVQCSADQGSGYQYETLWVMEYLKMIIEVIEESIGLDKIKEQFYSVALMLDLMFDYGLPLINSKPLLVSFLQMPAPGHHSLLNKATSILTSNTSASYS